jgi:hypothetical protein
MPSVSPFSSYSIGIASSSPATIPSTYLQPVRQRIFSQDACSELLEGNGRVGFTRGYGVPVTHEKDIGGHEGHAFVAVDKRMIARKPGGVRRSHRENIGLTVRKELLRSGERGFEQPFVADPKRAAMHREKLAVGPL